MRKEEKTQNVKKVLDSLIRQRHFEGKMREQKVFSLWREVVGAPLANHTQPASLSVAGILTVWTEHPAYQTELSLLKVKILEALNAQLGQAAVKDLRLTLRPAQRTGAPSGQGATLARENVSPPVRHRRALTPETLAQMEVSLAAVTDEPLKDALRRLFVTQSEESEENDFAPSPSSKNRRSR